MLSDRFRAAVEHGNVDEAADLFSEDAAFRSPVLFKPYEGRDQVVKVLRAAERVIGRPIKFSMGPRRAGDPPLLVASNDLARERLGWVAKRGTLEEMIGSAWAWTQRRAGEPSR